MSFDPTWEPSRLPSWEQKWGHAALPSDGHIGPEDAARLMVIFQAMSDDLGDLVANALYYEENRKDEYETARQKAFRESTASSDRKKEADADLDRDVELCRKIFKKARAVRVFIENKHDSAIRSHHALKTLLKDKSDEKWLN